jgi:hypothetical protein
MAAASWDGLGGPPGTRRRNPTDDTWYQLVGSLRQPCAARLRLHGRVSPRPWPIPLHPHCECEQWEVALGAEAPPVFGDLPGLMPRLGRSGSGPGRGPAELVAGAGRPGRLVGPVRRQWRGPRLRPGGEAQGPDGRPAPGGGDPRGDRPAVGRAGANGGVRLNSIIPAGASRTDLVPAACVGVPGLIRPMPKEALWPPSLPSLNRDRCPVGVQPVRSSRPVRHLGPGR